MLSYLAKLTSDQQLAPAVLLLSHPAVAAAWATAIGSADTFHPVVTLAARTAHSSWWGLPGAGCRTKAAPQWGTPPTVSVYCKHATAEVTDKGMAAFVAVAVGPGVPRVMESKKLWEVLLEAIIHSTALAHQTAPTDEHI